jgi:hypothetical protein
MLKTFEERKKLELELTDPERLLPNRRTAAPKHKFFGPNTPLDRKIALP